MTKWARDPLFDSGSMKQPARDERMALTQTAHRSPRSCCPFRALVARLSALTRSRNCRVGGAPPDERPVQEIATTGEAEWCRRSGPSSTDTSQLMAEVRSHRACPWESHISLFVPLAYGKLVDDDPWSTLAMISRSFGYA